MDGRASILKARLYPLKDIRTDQIDAIVRKLASVGLVSLYDVGGKPFIQTVSWDKHQRVRNSVKKYPEPCLQKSAASCGELRQTAASCGLNPIQSNPNPILNPIQSITDGQTETLGLTLSDAITLRDDQDAIFTEAKRCGLPVTQQGMDTAMELYASHGKDKLLTAIKKAGECANLKKPWQYVTKVLTNGERKEDDGVW